MIINNDVISVNLSLIFLINVNLFFFYYPGYKVIHTWIIDRQRHYIILQLIYYLYIHKITYQSFFLTF